MQANAILICMKCYIYGTRIKYICVSIITRICELAKGGGRGGGGGGRHDIYWATHSCSWSIEVMH